jgi:site-specific recombinase XerD
MDIAEALDAFVLQLQADGRSPHTIGQYRRHVARLVQWLHSEQRSADLDRLEPGTLARFLVADAAVPCADGERRRETTGNAVRTSLRVFFGFCHAAGIVPVNPARLVRRARCAPPPPRALCESEVAALLAAVDAGGAPAASRDAAMIRLLLGTGLRLSSALALAVRDVDLPRAELRVTRTKGDRPMTLPLAPPVAAELGAYLARLHGEWLFPGAGGGPLTRRQAGRRIEGWAAAAGLAGKATAHSLRHTFGMALYQKTADLSVVQKALGHRSVTSTTIYAQASAERLRAALGA